jgi:hypothetical protein
VDTESIVQDVAEARHLRASWFAYALKSFFTNHPAASRTLRAEATRTESAGKYLANSQDYFLLANRWNCVIGFQLSAGDFHRPPSSLNQGILCDYKKGNFPDYKKGNFPDYKKGNFPDYKKGIF